MYKNTSIHCWEDLACESSLRNPAVNTESKTAVQGRQHNLSVVGRKKKSCSICACNLVGAPFFSLARLYDESLTCHNKPTDLEAENPHPSLGLYLVRRVYTFVISGWNHAHMWLICSSHSSPVSTCGDTCGDAYIYAG